MKLVEYLSMKNLTQAQFAREIEETAQNVGRYVNGQRKPEDDKMLKIFTATGGLVTANDFYNIPSKVKTRTN